MKILIVEDEWELAQSLADYLQKEGYLCEVVQQLEQAHEKVQLYAYDVIILDITLPDGNGLDLLKKLKRDKKEAGVLIVSARDSLQDKLEGLNLGADDYITKPFHLAELNARVNSVIRRRIYQGNQEIVFEKISLNTDTREVKVNESSLVLTRKEYELLIYLLNNKNRVLTKEAIAEHLWGEGIDEADSFDFIYTHIKNLRKKIQDKGGDNYIKTIYGMGYKFTSV